MILTHKQEEGLKIAISRYHNHEPWTCISGYAGTGKSTLINFIIQALDISPEDVAYIAYTGKAANVLKQKGCANAVTAHKLLYETKPVGNGKFIFIPRTSLDKDYKLIVVDEISMLPKKMWDLLLSHHIYILATGDPEQLPPINTDENNHVLDCPHIFLDEIMRQAQESEIIRLSMHIRNGNPLSSFPVTGAQVQIIPSYNLVSGIYEWPDQILCATNSKRQEVNNILRQLNNYPQDPCIGDKVISLKNHWDTISIQGNPLTNGSIGKITSLEKRILPLPAYISKTPITVLVADILTEDGDIFHKIPIDYQALVTGQKSLDAKQEWQMVKNKYCPDPPYDYAYGYAITCHKAQGSEWNNVLVFEEKFPFDKTEHKKWLYTACTRASEKLVIVKT